MSDFVKNINFQVKNEKLYNAFRTVCLEMDMSIRAVMLMLINQLLNERDKTNEM